MGYRKREGPGWKQSLVADRCKMRAASFSVFCRLLAASCEPSRFFIPQFSAPCLAAFSPPVVSPRDSLVLAVVPDIFEDRLQHQLRGGLHHSIPDSGNSEWPFFQGRRKNAHVDVR